MKIILLRGYEQEIAELIKMEIIIGMTLKIMKHLYMVEVMEIHPTLFTIIFIVEKEVFILWIM